MAEITEQLWAREQIRDLLHRYCQGIDRRDWPLVRSCFAQDHRHRHGGFTGSADEFVAFASAVLGTIPVTHHTIGNVRIELAQDFQTATSEANFIAYHRIEAGHLEGTPVPTGGKETDWIVAGRYRDRLELRGGQWLIVQRDAVHDWERVDPVT
ncbi:MAG: hypothetical protein RL519_769 [Pseudomonadota bacterium]|jgi:3-phenylpropionate/cinnamic acid dioxygenase small subunit